MVANVRWKLIDGKELGPVRIRNFIHVYRFPRGSRLSPTPAWRGKCYLTSECFCEHMYSTVPTMVRLLNLVIVGMMRLWKVARDFSHTIKKKRGENKWFVVSWLYVNSLAWTRVSHRYNSVWSTDQPYTCSTIYITRSLFSNPQTLWFLIIFTPTCVNDPSSMPDTFTEEFYILVWLSHMWGRRSLNLSREHNKCVKEWWSPQQVDTGWGGKIKKEYKTEI